jgi:hypothetical protein
MPLICDWGSVPRRITVPKSELSLVGGTAYQITVDYWWQLLRELNGTVEGIAETVHHPIYVNIPPTSSTPRIIEVDATRYEVWAEDGLYSLEVVGGNTNWRDVEVKNQVSIGTNNVSGASSLSVEQDARLLKVEQSMFNRRRWDKVGNTVTIYDIDKITPMYVFDTNDDLSERK